MAGPLIEVACWGRFVRRGIAAGKAVRFRGCRDAALAAPTRATCRRRDVCTPQGGLERLAAVQTMGQDTHETVAGRGGVDCLDWYRRFMPASLATGHLRALAATGDHHGNSAQPAA